MEHADIAQLAAVWGAPGCALALLARGRRSVLAGLAVLASAEAALAFSLSGGGRLGDLASPAGAAAVLAGLLVLGAAAWLFVRWPALLAPAALAAAPFRPPIEFDTSHTLLVAVARDGQLGRLLPLYFVLGAALLALAWRTLRGEEPRALPRTIALPAVAFFAWALLSLLWADDLEAGANLLVFFTLPFAGLLAVVGRAPFPDWLPRVLGVIAVGLATLFALVGLWQAATHKLFFFAPNLQVSNANTDYFRVTSLFGDPSLYGRHVVLGIGILLVALAARRMNAWLGVGLIALLWAGLLFSYSQSSMAALVVVTLAVAAAAGDGRVRRAVGVVAAVSLLIGLGFAGFKLLTGTSLNRVTSDRTERVADTTRVIQKHPLIGVGIGGQPRASRELANSDRPTPAFVSHTTPLTVAAELGVLGLALYTWLLVGGARLIRDVRRLDDALGLALGAAFLALFVHSLWYSGFLEDPLTWVVLAVAAAYVTVAGRVAEPVA
jgi:O-antigen ligase/polysaccharide polymerase Wzy-like membrane protein